MNKKSVRFLCMLLAVGSAFSLQLTGQADAQWKTFRVPAADTIKAVYYVNNLPLTSEDLLSKSTKDILIAGQGSIQYKGSAKAKRRKFIFEWEGSSQRPELFAKGLNVTIKEGKANRVQAIWSSRAEKGSYGFILHALPDSTDKITLYTAYVMLPGSSAWKLIAAFKNKNDGQWLKGYGAGGTDAQQISPWIQNNRGRWTELLEGENFTRKSVPPAPVLDWARNLDSAAQLQTDKEAIAFAVRSGKLDTTASREGVYYQIVKAGTGNRVKLTDSVTVFYKGSLLSDGSVFDQTKDKPITFPLNRLIRGWQIALPESNVGGTVRVIIPSALAYGIRTRSKSIPPNSILVFDIEVVDAKPLISQR